MFVKRFASEFALVIYYHLVLAPLKDEPIDLACDIARFYKLQVQITQYDM